MSNNNSMLDLIDDLNGMEIVFVDYDSGYVTTWNGSSSFNIYYISDNYWKVTDMFTHYGCEDSEHAKQIAIDHKYYQDNKEEIAS